MQQKTKKCKSEKNAKHMQVKQITKKMQNKCKKKSNHKKKSEKNAKKIRKKCEKNATQPEQQKQKAKKTRKKRDTTEPPGGTSKNCSTPVSKVKFVP